MSDAFWQALAAGLAMMLIFEGVIPFLYPQRWRRLIEQLSQVSDQALRLIGLTSMLLGVLLLYWIR